MKRAMQQTLIEFTKPSVLNGGIRGYNFSHPVLSDTEEEKKRTIPTLVKAVRTLGLIPGPIMIVKADPGAPPNALEK